MYLLSIRIVFCIFAIDMNKEPQSHPNAGVALFSTRLDSRNYSPSLSHRSTSSFVSGVLEWLSFPTL